MKKKTIMAVPVPCFWIVIGTCLLGIIVGSFCDFSINEALANKTELGTFFASYGSYFSYCLYPAAGACLFVGLNKKGERYRLLAYVLLFLSFFMAVYYSTIRLYCRRILSAAVDRQLVVLGGTVFVGAVGDDTSAG